MVKNKENKLNFDGEISSASISDQMKPPTPTDSGTSSASVSDQMGNKTGNKTMPEALEGGVLIPELRFEGFSGEWEEKKLEEIAIIERGRFSPRPRNNPIYYGGSIPFVQTSDVVHSNGLITHFPHPSLKWYNN